MSRIILSRWPNGDERVVVGYDRPLDTFFADEYPPDDEDDEVITVGPMVGMTIRSPSELAKLATENGIAIDWTATLIELLESHVDLDYPASNKVVDLT